MLVMAVDPGGTTGVVVYEDGEVYAAQQFAGGKDGMSFRAILEAELKVVRGLVGELLKWEPEVLVIEDFILYGGVDGFGDSGARSGLAPVRLIAMLVFAMNGVLPESGGFNVSIVFQGAGERLVIKDEYLKEKGLYIAGLPHAMDALRHAIVFERKNRKIIRPA